jgi:hypothetical protein
MLDGFIEVESNEFLKAYNNIQPIRNEVSPYFKNIKSQNIDATNNRLLIDTFYGQVYTDNVLNSVNIYGPTERLPTFSGDNLANYGFLRVPFRRIPRILINSSEELHYIVNSIWSKDPSLKLLFRGQTKEYLIGRKPETLQQIFGSPDALEPSLLPSASRKKIRLEEILPEFSALLQIFCKIRLMSIQENSDDTLFRQNLNDYSNLIGSYNLYFMALALAQHYGLPSAGLDVTDDLDVALFFALHEFKGDKGAPYYFNIHKRSSHGEPSVIYLLSGNKRFYLDYEKTIPSFIQSIRPQRQNAKFLHSGWGYNLNDCARRLFMALYLDPEGDFVCKYNKKYLFPGPEEDSFGAFLSAVKSSNIPKNLEKFLSYFYWIK